MNDYYYDPRPSHSRKWLVLSLVIVLLIIGGLVVAVAIEHQNNDGASQAAVPTASAEASPSASASNGTQNTSGGEVALGGSLKEMQENEDAVVQVAENLTPSVVSIVGTSASSMGSGTSVSSGSGIIISEEGYILTNNHVVEDAQVIKVVLLDGTEAEAKLVGRDEATDLAVIKVDLPNLVAAPLGDSDAIKTGQMAIAVGSPLGTQLSGTVTVGYISAKDRTITNEAGRKMNMIQTDAAINPGNSGGALANLKGEVIGINTSKNTTIGYDEYGNAISAEGLGFAIPINDAIPVAQQLIANGSIPRPWVGFTYTQFTEQDAKSYNIPVGLFVRSVVSGSPADKAGIQQGDLVTEVNGTPISDDVDMQDILSGVNVGQTIKMKIYREQLNREIEVEVTLGDYTDYEAIQEQQTQQQQGGQQPWGR